MKILYVDDEPLNRELFLEIVGIIAPGIEVVCCESVAQAQEEDILQFDSIFSDIAMPQTDGFAFFDLLKQRYHYNKPIIAVTAFAVDGDRERILMYGFDDYIPKPIEIKKLESIISHYLEDRK